jgi:hypothetical protein
MNYSGKRFKTGDELAGGTRTAINLSDFMQKIFKYERFSLQKCSKIKKLSQYACG